MNIDYNKWCKRCISYKLNITSGILCGLTDAKPNFIDNCKDFRLDEEKEKYSVLLENELSKREKRRNEDLNSKYFDFLYETKLLLPLLIIVSIIMIYSFDYSNAKSILFTAFVVIYTLILIIRTKYIPKNVRYVNIENNRVKKMFGPGIVTFISFKNYKKIELDNIAPDLINDKYDYKIKSRINEYLKNKG